MDRFTDSKNFRDVALVLVAVLLLGFLTVDLQVAAVGMDLHFILHKNVLEGKAPSPWQYRIFGTYLAEGVIDILEKLDVPRHTSVGFIAVRRIQSVLVFLLAYLYYKKLGLSVWFALLGISLLAWAISHSFIGSSLEIGIHFDLIFYLLAGLLILLGRPFWLIPISLVAALNRETSGLIPFMVIALYSPVADKKERLKLLGTGSIALVFYGIVFVALRLIYDPTESVAPYNREPGFELLAFNLFRMTTWVQLLATLGVLPMMAWIAFRRWPHPLKMFFWIIAPLWIIIHLFLGVLAETRLLLVPHALISIPGALFLLNPERRVEHR